MLLSPFVSLGSSLAANGPGGPRSVDNGSGTAVDAWTDLPAMALTPDDLPEPGYGATSSWLLDVRAYASANQDNEAAAASTAHSFAGYGFLMAWLGHLSLPGTLDGVDINRKVVGQQIIQFATADGARKGFNAIAATKFLGGDQEISAPVIGDESRVATDTTSGDVTVNHLNVLIRSGEFVIEINFSALDSETAPRFDASIRAVAETLLDRVHEVVKSGGPGLSRHALRLTLIYGVATTASLFYERLNDRTVPLYEDAAANVDPDATKEPGRAPDIFYVFQYANGGQDGPSLEGRVLRFASEGDAEAWVASKDFSSKDNYAELTPSETIGDQTVAASYDYPDIEDGAPHTLSVIARVGDTVAWIAVNHSEAPKLENVESLAKLQIACLADESPCAPISPDLIVNAAA
jgi:hypothetical protein